MKEYIVKVKVIDSNRDQRGVEFLIDHIISEGIKRIDTLDYGIIEVLLKGADYK